MYILDYTFPPLIMKSLRIVCPLVCHVLQDLKKMSCVTVSSVQFTHSVVSDSLESHGVQHHGLQHAKPPCPSATPGIYSSWCPLSRWCHPTISCSVVPFSSCPQSFPASGSFQMTLNEYRIIHCCWISLFLVTQVVITGYLILIDSCWILTLILFFFFFSLNIALFKLIMSSISLCHIFEEIWQNVDSHFTLVTGNPKKYTSLSKLYILCLLLLWIFCLLCIHLVNIHWIAPKHQRP